MRLTVRIKKNWIYIYIYAGNMFCSISIQYHTAVCIMTEIGNYII